MSESLIGALPPAYTQPLPGTPGPALSALWGELSGLERDALLPHLLGGTSAEWLSQILREAGRDISATTIRTYRRSLRGPN